MHRSARRTLSQPQTRPGPRLLATLALALATCAAAAPAAGAWGPWLGDLPPQPAGRELLLGAGAGYERLDDQDLLALQLQASHRRERLRLGLGLPLRFGLGDGALRQADWDEVADFGRVLQLGEYGEPGEALHVRLGELASATLGHGALVNQFFAGVDPDHHHTGLWVDGQLGPHLGGEALIDDLLAPTLLGGRAYLRPWGRNGGVGAVAAERLLFGASLVVDRSAPLSLSRTCPGQPVGLRVPCPGPEQLQLDRVGLPRVSEQTSLVLGGLDAALGLVDGPGLQLVGHAELAGILDHGAGAHLGLQLAAQPTTGVSGGLRLEYRYAGAGYQPGYVGTLYLLERRGLARGVPQAARLDGLPGGHGVYGELALGFQGGFTLAALWEQLQGGDGGVLTLRGEVPGPGPLRAGLHYRRPGVDQAARLLGLDGSLLQLELRAQLTPLVYAEAHYGRQWRIAAAPTPEEPYQSIASGGLALGASLVW